jgi:hypothetical protein
VAPRIAATVLSGSGTDTSSWAYGASSLSSTRTAGRPEAARLPGEMPCYGLRGRSTAYQATCAVLNVTSAWNVRPHFSMTRRDARCAAAVTLMIRASGVCDQPNRIAERAPSVASPRPQYSGASSKPTSHLSGPGQSASRLRPIRPAHWPVCLSSCGLAHALVRVGRVDYPGPGRAQATRVQGPGHPLVEAGDDLFPALLGDVGKQGGGAFGGTGKNFLGHRGSCSRVERPTEVVRVGEDPAGQVAGPGGPATAAGRAGFPEGRDVAADSAVSALPDGAGGPRWSSGAPSFASRPRPPQGCLPGWPRTGGAC